MILDVLLSNYLPIRYAACHQNTDLSRHNRYEYFRNRRTRSLPWTYDCGFLFKPFESFSDFAAFLSLVLPLETALEVVFPKYH